MSEYRRTPKYQRGESRKQPSSLHSWLRGGPPENGYAVRGVSFRLHDRNQVDIDVGVRILVLVGITSDRIDARICFLLLSNDPMPLTPQSMPGIAGLKKFSPSSVFIVGPRNWLKARRPRQAQSQAAVAGFDHCRFDGLRRE
jgi:hypothetical protein